MTPLDRLAREVDASGRSLRRAAARGTIRCRRVSERRVRVDPAEERYVRLHWQMLSALVESLRTMPNVRLAVLFGSLARGDARSASDVDVVVRFARTSLHARALLVDRLEQATGRRVHVVELADAVRAPLLLADVLHDGRVLVDRDRDWPRLQRRERKIRADAAAAERQLTDDVAVALEELEALRP